MIKKYKELILFGVSGGIAFVIDATATSLLSSLLGVYGARVPAFLLGASSTWLFNRNITFDKATSRHTSLMREYLHYLSLMVAGLAINYCAYAVAVSFLKHVHYGILLSVGIGSIAGMGINFVNSKRYIFNKPASTPKD